MLLELMVTIPILAVIAVVSLRLVFLSDRALTRQDEQTTATGGQAQLLEDLGRDLRGASETSAGSGWLSVSSPHRVTYEWSAAHSATVRRVAGQQGETREYPGLRLSASVSGRVTQVEIRGKAITVRTAVWMRG